MKKSTSGEIYRAFKEVDKDTIIRRTNLRYFAKENDIDYYTTEGIWFVDFNQFLQKVNPKNIPSQQTLPRLRTKISAQREWNKKHRRKIKHHIIDVICASGKVRVFTLGKRNIINYDELEQEIKRILKEKNKY